MTYRRRGYELKMTFLGRAIRPFHLAVAISTGSIAVANILFDGVILNGHTGDLVGVFALVSSVFLTIGWWFRSDRFAEWGLLIAAGCWAARATFGALQDSGWFGIAASIAWLVGASGAYILERYEHQAVLDNE